jgi:SpoVK/Ycf46/Vps4 family AAA+-type ATPase
VNVCASCAAANRPIAKFCKACGTAFALPDVGTLLNSLVGLDDLRAALDAIRAEAEGRRRAGRDPRRARAMLIIGESGTAKSRLGPLITQFLHSLQLLDRAVPVVVNALQQEDLESKKLDAAFTAAKGSVLFIDNAQMLMSPTGEPKAPFNQLMHLMEASPIDPVVIMAGLPTGLEEFCQRTESRNLLSRFNSVFRLADYLPEQLAQICAKTLVADGFTLSEETEKQLLMRMRWLYRAVKGGDKSIRSVNGRMALEEAAEIERRTYARGASDNAVLPEDVPGPADRVKPIEEIMAELDGFIGMHNIKAEIRALYQDIQNAKKRQAMGLGDMKDGKYAYHFILLGNPGTGKTTVARALGEVFEAMGVLPTGHVVEVDRSKLVGEYQGHTASKVVAACKQAEGGILFVDEAYALSQGANDSFGKEAVDTLLKRMEDDRGKYVVIAAGYDREMQEFLRINSGLESRFPQRFKLDDYTAEELTDIFASIAKKQRYMLGEGTREKLLAFFAARVARKTPDFANGREARNLVEKVERALSKRMSLLETPPDAQQMCTFMPEDVPDVGAGSQDQLKTSMAELESLIGLQGVKASVRLLQAALKRDRVLGNHKPLERHFLFTGSPGTGKTTVARLMAKIFHGLGLLPTDRVVEVTRSELVSAYRADTPKMTNKAIDNAMGGVLFVDEAYSLLPPGAQGDPGIEAVNTLLKRMEDDRGKFIVIAAGYQAEMEVFLDSNSGLRSRFSDTIDFTDYDATEMQRIFEMLCRPDGLQRAPGFDDALAVYLRHVFDTRDASFANARTVRQLFNKVCANCADRVTALDLPDDELPTAMRLLTVADLPPLPTPGGPL